MTWSRLAWDGCWRRPARTLVTAAGVAIALAAGFSLLAFQWGYRRSLTRELDRLGAQILVVPKGCPYDAASLALHGANWPCHLKQSYLEEVRAVPGVAVAAPAFMTAFFAANAQHTVYVGIESNLLALKPGWRIDGAFPAGGQVLPGADVAQRLGWRPGQTVALPGLTGVSGVVSGILAPTQSGDDTFIFLPLIEAQRRFHHPNELTHVLVRLRDPNQVESVVAGLRGCDAGMNLNVVPLAHLFRTIQSLANATHWFLACATLVALLSAGAGVSAALLIAVAERTREIGVLRALGASQADVFRVIWLEALQMCGLGAVIGVGGAWAAMGALEGWLRGRLPFTPQGDLMACDGWIVAACLMTTVLLGSAAALGPAWRASRMPPYLAMRSKGVRT